MNRRTIHEDREGKRDNAGQNRQRTHGKRRKSRRGDLHIFLATHHLQETAHVQRSLPTGSSDLARHSRTLVDAGSCMSGLGWALWVLVMMVAVLVAAGRRRRRERVVEEVLPDIVDRVRGVLRSRARRGERKRRRASALLARRAGLGRMRGVGVLALGRVGDGEDVEEELGLAEVRRGAAGARGECEDGHAGLAHRLGHQRAPEHGEVVAGVGLHRVSRVEVGVLARAAAPALFVGRGRRAGAGAEAHPAVLAAQVLVPAEQVRVLPFLVLVAPHTAGTVPPYVADADELAVDHLSATGARLGFCEATDVVVHLPAVCELREGKLCGEGRRAVLCVLRLLRLADLFAKLGAAVDRGSRNRRNRVSGPEGRGRHRGHGGRLRTRTGSFESGERAEVFQASFRWLLWGRRYGGDREHERRWVSVRVRSGRRGLREVHEDGRVADRGEVVLEVL